MSIEKYVKTMKGTSLIPIFVKFQMQSSNIVLFQKCVIVLHWAYNGGLLQKVNRSPFKRHVLLAAVKEDARIKNDVVLTSSTVYHSFVRSWLDFSMDW